MPEFSATIVLPCSAGALRTLLGTAANLPRVRDPDLELEIIAAPEVVTVAERIEFRVTSFGFKHRSIHIYTTVSDVEIADEQLEGPMRAWRHRQTFEFLETQQARLTDEFEFEPPGGMMGFVLTEARLRDSLKDGIAARHAALQELIAIGELQ